jgi:predicted N-formylglutamate amidohydrolase
VRSGPLLGPGDPAPVTVANPGGRASLLLVCDHAGAAVPAALGDLGVPAPRWREHIAYDIGALAVARRLAERLDAPLVHSTYSRLVVDPNRFPDHPASITPVSDGVPIPGNQDLDPAAREARLAEHFRPYHRALAARLDAFAAAGTRSLVVSVHTFTPRMDGRDRPWHVGVLWHRDEATAHAALEAFRRVPGLVVGDNQPYSALEPLGYTSVTHCEERALPHLLLELRQDLVAEPPGQARFAGVVEHALRAIWSPLGRPGGDDGARAS